jgi:hypothetical protein
MTKPILSVSNRLTRPNPEMFRRRNIYRITKVTNNRFYSVTQEIQSQNKFLKVIAEDQDPSEDV